MCHISAARNLVNSKWDNFLHRVFPQNCGKLSQHKKMSYSLNNKKIPLFKRDFLRGLLSQIYGTARFALTLPK